ncbi:hypothetical protein BDV24DRAFT_121749 [Aspergillus arachidicola]|uniref:Uncharacterized protein n=1 Tax=Aspergillus arachidicola TaxID=656916 RepID=A0A5N6YRB8_9EURO|nr:hypothetical protein BDV24DRAFT_121749 [Aspergillus arachidicola]
MPIAGMASLFAVGDGHERSTGKLAAGFAILSDIGSKRMKTQFYCVASPFFFSRWGYQSGTLEFLVRLQQYPQVGLEVIATEDVPG